MPSGEQVRTTRYTQGRISPWERAMVTVRRRMQSLPPLAGDSALTLIAALCVALPPLFVRPGPPGASPWQPVVLGTLCAAALLGRSRWPVGSLLAVGGLGTVYLLVGCNLFGLLPTVLIAVYSAVADSTRPRPQVWAIAVGVCVLLQVANLYGHDPGPGPGGRFDFTRLLTDSTWMLMGLLLGEALRGHRAFAREAELRAAQAEQFQREEAQRRVAEERLQIARELHDILAHTVAIINVQAGVAAHVIDQQPEQARVALTHIKDASRATLQELRALVGVLRETEGSAPRAPTPGLSALDELVDSVRGAGVTVDLEVALPPQPLPSTVDVAAYRILQEALTNVIKHAGRALVRVSVRGDGNQLTLDVVNQATGNGPAPRGEGSGNGLLGMRERAGALGGSVSAGPLPDGGFRVRAALPIPGGS